MRAAVTVDTPIPSPTNKITFLALLVFLVRFSALSSSFSANRSQCSGSAINIVCYTYVHIRGKINFDTYILKKYIHYMLSDRLNNYCFLNHTLCWIKYMIFSRSLHNTRVLFVQYSNHAGLGFMSTSQVWNSRFFKVIAQCHSNLLINTPTKLVCWV